METVLLEAGLPPHLVVDLVGGSAKYMMKFQEGDSDELRKIKELAKGKSYWIDEKMRDLILNKSGFAENDLAKFRQWCLDNPLP